MGLEDKHLDVLQNIESSVGRVYNQNPALRDVEVIRAYEYSIKHYQQKILGRVAETDFPDEEAATVFRAIVESLNQRDELLGAKEEDTPEPPKRFSRAFKEPTKDEIYLTCLRKILKSSKRWSNRGGERGYLDFISNYV